MLEALGVTEAEERLYHELIEHPQATLAELSAAIGVSRERARRTAAGLERVGLVSRRPGSPARFLPAPPDVAVEALVMHRLEELERARLYAARLGDEFRRRAHEERSSELIEIISGREAIHQRSIQLIDGAGEEVLMFDKPPYVGPQESPIQYAALARGVAWRAVYTREALELPDRLDQLHRLRDAGEQARVTPRLPLKLAIVDRRLALLPLIADYESAGSTAVLVRRCSLLTTLITLFDMLWQQALPLSPVALRPAGPETALAPEDQELLLMLTAGLKDEVIARRLGVSLRTAGRRLSRLMEAHGVETRFQLGLLAAKRGWS